MVDQHDPVPVPAGRVRAQQFACTAADGVPLVGDHFAGAAARGGIGTAVFAHGFGQTRHAWHASARAIAGHGWETRCFDARGHGQSGWNDADQAYRLDQFVADARTIAGIGARPPVWVGASMGGLLGLLAQGEAEAAQGAAPHGSAGPFAALVLVDITPRWESAGVERILGFMRAHPHGFASLEAAADAIARYLPHRRRKSSQQLATLLVDDGAGRLRWHWDPRLLQEMASDAERWQARLVQAARSIGVPTLLVSGALSDLVSDATVEEFLGLVPHARHVRIEGATHMVAGDRNDVFTDAIVAFLDALSTARGAPARAGKPGSDLPGSDLLGSDLLRSDLPRSDPHRSDQHPRDQHLSDQPPSNHPCSSHALDRNGVAP